MKKQILTILLFLISALAFACDCAEINPILEFYSSEYVFEGKIFSKVYSKDKLTYKITFDISKHYKNGDSPKTLAFDVRAEGKYAGVYTSCDWKAEKNQKWIVYASKNNGKLTFSGICSNSRVIDNIPIDLREQKMLDNGNSFQIEDYIFEFEYDFSYCANITDIRSILEKGKIKNYETQTTLLNVFIDANGNLKSVTRQKELIIKKDSIFDLITEIGDANIKSVTELENDAIELISQAKKWEIKKHSKTGINVPYLKHIWVYYNLKTNKWSYEL